MKQILSLLLLSTFLFSIVTITAEARLVDNLGIDRVAKTNEVFKEDAVSEYRTSCQLLQNYIFENPEYKNHKYVFSRTEYNNEGKQVCKVMQKNVDKKPVFIKTTLESKHINGIEYRTQKYKYHYAYVNGKDIQVYDYTIKKIENYIPVLEVKAGKVVQV